MSAEPWKALNEEDRRELASLLYDLRAQGHPIEALEEAVRYYLERSPNPHCRAR